MDDVRAELQGTTRQLLAKELPLESAVERADAAEGWMSLWRRVTTDLGVAAVTVDESHGGLGLGLGEMSVVVEESGRALSPLPLIDAMAGSYVLRDAAPDLLEGLAAGGVILGLDASLRGSIGVSATSGVLSGRSGPVIAGEEATHLVVWLPDGDLAVVALGGPGVERRISRALDPTRGVVTFELLQVEPLHVVTDPDGRLRRRVTSLQRLGAALDSVGAARVCLDLAVDHAGSREQFGRPIGSFQAVKHTCAEMLLALETGVSAARAAAHVPGGADDPSFDAAASLAYDYCGRSFAFVAASTIQVLGGIGFTWEHPAHLFLKRAAANALVGGTGVEVRRELAVELGLVGVGDRLST